MASGQAEIVLAGDQGGGPEADVIHLRSSARLAELLESLGLDPDRLGEHGPKGAATARTDWGSSQLVFVRSGHQPSGGYRLEIVKFDTALRPPVLRLRVSPPGPDEAVTMVVTRPWVLVKTPRTESDVAVVLEGTSQESRRSVDGDPVHEDR
jgi:hypothetical protein